MCGHLIKEKGLLKNILFQFLGMEEMTLFGIKVFGNVLRLKFGIFRSGHHPVDYLDRP